MQMPSRKKPIPQSPFPGKLRIGLGGEGVLRTTGQHAAARAVIEAAFDEGIRYFDSAVAYAGSQGYYGEFWQEHQQQRNQSFLTSKSAARTYTGAMADLALSLDALTTDHLDLWQAHDIRTDHDLLEAEKPGGALRAFMEAKETGVVRYIGATGHADPGVLAHAVEYWPIDTVLMPVNPVEVMQDGFLETIMEPARNQGIRVIGMKTLGAGHFLLPESGITAEVLIRFALAQQVDQVIVGCSTPEEVRALVTAGRAGPLEADEADRVAAAFLPHAAAFAYYRSPA